MEDEVRHILRDTVKNQNHQVSKLGSRIAARFMKLELTDDLPELHPRRASVRAATRRNRKNVMIGHPVDRLSS